MKLTVLVEGNPTTHSASGPTYITRLLAKLVECSPLVQETWVHSQVESYQNSKKWYLMQPCLTLSIIRYKSRVKCNNPGKGVAPFPTLRCSSYWKGDFQVTLDCGRPICFLLIYIYIFIYICLCMCLLVCVCVCVCVY